MSIKNKSKDHLVEHGGIELVEPVLAPQSDDPLRFWTDHPTESVLVDLHVFADGESENPGTAPWAGPFTGRPELIAELAPALKARLMFAAPGTCSNHTFALRSFWRAFDQLESTRTHEGHSIQRLTTVRDLTHLHEIAAHSAAIDSTRFSNFLTVANDARRLLRIGPLPWTKPKPGEPERQLIPQDQAKALRIAIKRDWRRVLQVWDRHQSIRDGLVHPDAEQDEVLQRSGENREHTIRAAIASLFSEQGGVLLRKLWDRRDAIPAAIARLNAEDVEVSRRNWLHFEQVQKKTGRALPTPAELLDGTYRHALTYQGIEASAMRAIAFPTVEDADIAFHMALADSGWNPSTFITGIDATLPKRVFQHPKDSEQSVLVIDDAQEAMGEELEEVGMQGTKRRAGGRLQFCMGLKKNPACPPNVVAAYLQRTARLREQLHQDCEVAHARLKQLRDDKESQAADIERQFKLLQRLRQGVRNVWLYVDQQGRINWIDGKEWARYRVSGTSKKVSYLDRVIGRVNAERAMRGEPQIARIVPSDFRDIYAHWVVVQTGGSVIAVMLALGHATLRSSDAYLTNNILNAESDETVRQFMTHLFAELEQGRVDLTILAQLVRHGPLTSEMHARLTEYRRLLRSRVKAGCADAMHPPPHIAPNHVEGKWCGPQRCLRNCPHARFLPESVDGIAMRVEELLSMTDHLPLNTGLGGEFDKELEEGEYLLDELYPKVEVDKARKHWRQQIESGKHVVPGVGLVRGKEVA